MKKNKANLFAGITQESLRRRKKTAQPKKIAVELATLTDSYFSSNDWIYEHKFDGVRCIAHKYKGKIRLLSRNYLTMNGEYPELIRLLSKQSADNFIIDGEIIAVGRKGVSDFQLLQSRINLEDAATIQERSQKITIAYCIFDVMYAGGYDLRALPLLARKKILKRLLKYNKKLVYTTHKTGNGITYFKEACKKGWEGLIAKKYDSPYVGKRSKDWLKFKCIMKQELAIGGFTTGRGSRNYFGALLVGYYKQGKFMYAGKVGTGFSQETLRILGTQLQKLEITECPFANYDESPLGVHWVKPRLVAEFQFANWTTSGKLRVGRYKGLREDKAEKDVVKEVAKPISIR